MIDFLQIKLFIVSHHYYAFVFFFLYGIYINIYWNLKKYLVIFLLCWNYFIIRIIIWVSWAFHSFTQNICKLKFIEIHKFFFPFLNRSYIFELDLVIYIYFEFWIYVYYFIFLYFLHYSIMSETELNHIILYRLHH